MALEYQVHHSETLSTNTFDVTKFYEELHEFTLMREWGPQSDIDFPEKYYWESTDQQGRKELWIWWRLEKDFAASTMFSMKIDIDLHAVNLQETEVMWNNQKYRVHKGKMEMFIKGKVVIDPQNAFANSKIFAPFVEMFWKRWQTEKFRWVKIEVMKECIKFQNLARKFFVMVPPGKTSHFYPPRGYEDRDELA